MSRLDDAACEYLDRQARYSHPEGTFEQRYKGDKRFWPSEKETQECCRFVPRPSDARPFSLMWHCRSAVHVANLYDVDVTDLRRRARELAPATRLDDAAREYLARQARQSHPDGTFAHGLEGDRTFQPSEKEKQECCNAIRRPTYRHPFSLMTHCRSVEHVANLYNVDVTELRRRSRELKATNIETPAVLDTPEPTGPTIGSAA